MPYNIHLPHNETVDRHNAAVDRRVARDRSEAAKSPYASPRQIAFIERLVEEREMSEEQVSWTLDRIRAHKAAVAEARYGDQMTKVMASRIIGQRRGTDGPYINGLLSLPVKEGYEKDRFKAFVSAPAGTTKHPDTEEAERVAEQRWGANGYEQADREAADPEPDVPEIIVPRRTMKPAKIGIYQHNDNIYVVRKRRGSDRVVAYLLVDSPPRLAANGKTVHHDWQKDYRMIWVLTPEERVTDDDAIRELQIKVGACVMCGHAIWQAKSVRRMMGTRCYKRVHGLI